MKITFADSFWKSLDTLKRHQTWWYRTYSLFRYKIPMFFKNIWYFKQQLWEFRGWDYSHNLFLFARSLEQTADYMEKYGMEESVGQGKKIKKIRRAVTLINSIISNDYIGRVEKQIGELKNTDWFLGENREDTPEEAEHNRKVFKMAQEFEEFEWNELWMILRGQDINEYKTLLDKLSPEEKKENDVWNEWYDGSGIKSWWD